MGSASLLHRLARICGALCIAAALLAPALADPVPIGRRITHPGGAALRLNTIEFRAASIVVAATITNPTDREISLNRARSLVLDDDAHGVYRLNPPLDNPELRLGPHAQAAAELVFVGRLAPGTHQLTLSANAGVGTADNPFDAAPVFRAAFPVDNPPGDAGRRQANHPNGAALWVQSLVVGPGGCVVTLHAANGSERTIVLNQDRSLVLSDDQGHSAPADPPAENAELVVPPGDRLDATLVFDCHALDAAGALTLSTNRGTAGTPDNPYETLPVFSLTLPARQSPGEATAPARSHATASPIARSSLEAPEAIAAGAAPAAQPPPAAPPAAKPEARAKPPEKPPTNLPEKPPGPVAVPSRIPQTVPQLEAALHAKRDDRGLHVVLPADALFGATPAALEAAAEPLLRELAALIAATHPRLVIVSGHTDSNGNDDDNLALSKERAHAVAGWLEAQAAKARPHLIERGYGRTRPLAPNHKSDGSDNPDGRAQNRRIEVTLHR